MLNKNDFVSVGEIQVNKKYVSGANSLLTFYGSHVEEYFIAFKSLTVITEYPLKVKGCQSIRLYLIYLLMY